MADIQHSPQRVTGGAQGTVSSSGSDTNTMGSHTYVNYTELKRDINQITIRIGRIKEKREVEGRKEGEEGKKGKVGKEGKNERKERKERKKGRNGRTEE